MECFGLYTSQKLLRIKLRRFFRYLKNLLTVNCKPHEKGHFIVIILVLFSITTFSLYSGFKVLGENLASDIKNLLLNVYQFNARALLLGQQRYPFVFIIGAMKCGTYHLAHFLAHHPNIRIMNELEYFDKHSKRKSYEWYRQRMPYTLENEIVIEKTAAYFYSPPGNFKEYQAFLHADNWAFTTNNFRPENLKFILIVCDPLKRAVSHYQMFKTSDRTILTRKQALRVTNETTRVNDYLEYGKYGYYINAHYHSPRSQWLKVFSLDQFLIVDGNKFQHHNPASILSEVEKFLDISEYFQEKDFALRKDRKFFCHISLLGCGPPQKGRKHEPLDSSQIAHMISFYQKDLETFTNLTGLLLSMTGAL